jgi:hypothetical protein
MNDQAPHPLQNAFPHQQLNAHQYDAARQHQLDALGRSIDSLTDRLDHKPPKPNILKRVWSWFRSNPVPPALLGAFALVGQLETGLLAVLRHDVKHKAVLIGFVVLACVLQFLLITVLDALHRDNRGLRVQIMMARGTSNPGAQASNTGVTPPPTFGFRVNR